MRAGAPAGRRASPLRRFWPVIAGSMLVVAAGLAAVKLESERRGGPSDPRALSAEFARSGDYQNAANVLRAAYRAKPDEQLRLEAARAYLVSGDNYSTIELLKDHSTESAFEFSRRHLYAEALVRARRYDAAAQEAELLAASSGGDGRARLLLARVAYGLGDFDRASRELGAAIRIGGESQAEAWLFRARIALNDNDLEAARGAAARAASANAPPAALSAIEIEALARAGDYVGAKAALAALAASKDPLARLLALKLGAFLDASEGRYREAARLLRDIGGIVEADPYGDLFIARVEALDGDAAQSAARVKRALEASPDNGAIAEAGVDRLVEAGALDEAAAAAQHLQEREPRRGVRAAMQVARARSDFDALARLALAAPLGAPPSSIDAMVFGPRSHAAARSADARAADKRLVDAAAAARRGDDGAAVEAALALAGPGADPPALLLAGEILIAANSDAAARRLFESAAGSPAALIGLVRLDVRAGDLLGAERRLALNERAGELVLVRARAVARQGRLEDAAAILAPLAADWPASAQDAVFAAGVFAETGAGEALAALAAHARRRFAGTLEASEVFLSAGLEQEALLAARAAVLASSPEGGRAERYADIARRLGRIAEARAFLAELASSAGDNPALARAVRILDGGPPEALADDDPVQIREARNAYLGSPHSAEAAFAYGEALAAQGEGERAIRLKREACFWSSAAVCDRQ